MRILISLVTTAATTAMLIFPNAQAFALGCTDIAGAKFDPDLKVMSTNYGRLLPDSKQISETKQQIDAITLKRLVATKINTTNASARLSLASNNNSQIVATINGKTINHTTPSNPANLGLVEPKAKIAAALAAIGKPAQAYTPPPPPSNVNLATLSPTNREISAGQHQFKIVGTPITEKSTTIQYTCTKDLEFAGDPADLVTMVVLRGVLKATTITKTTTIARSLDFKIIDIATFQSVTRDQFLKIFTDVPQITRLMVTKPIATEPVAIKTAPVPVVAPKSTPKTSRRPAQYANKKKPSWALILFAALLSVAVIYLARRHWNETH